MDVDRRLPDECRVDKVLLGECLGGALYKEDFRCENFGYMAAGKSMIVSDIPVLREVLIDGLSARLVRPDSVSEWIAAVTALRDDALREQLGRSAQAIFLSRYTWRQRAAAVLALPLPRKA